MGRFAGAVCNSIHVPTLHTMGLRSLRALRPILTRPLIVPKETKAQKRLQPPLGALRRLRIQFTPPSQVFLASSWVSELCHPAGEGGQVTRRLCV